MWRRVLPGIILSVLSLNLPLRAPAQERSSKTEAVSPKLTARIRQLVATLGPDPTRGTCMPNPYLPTNEAKRELTAIGKPATLPLCAVLKEKDTWRRIMA